MINNIRLQNFRSYRDDSFEFDPGVNIIVGPNASGKTNLLEAVMVLAQGGSFRARDVDLLRFKAPWSRLDGDFDGRNRSLKLEPSPALLQKTHLLDDQPFKRLSLERTEPIVFFEPNHLQLMTRGPEARRDYMDGLLLATIPSFRIINNGYRRALAQRNALLKKGPREARQQLFAWDVRLGELGSQIAIARQSLVDTLNKHLAKIYSQIAGRRSRLRVEYASQFLVEGYASRLVSRLEKTTETDIQRGFTGHGPHREDFLFYLNNQPAGVSASRGETRSLLLALKAIELKLVEKARDQKPILLLDDVFSELDGARRQALVQLLADHQAIITTTDADAAVEYFGTNHHLIPLIKN